jgi:hypothetical protein
MERVFGELEGFGIHPEANTPEQQPDSDLLTRVKAHAQNLLAPEKPGEAVRAETVKAALAAREVPVAEAPADLVVEYLKKKGIPYQDQREKGGALWIIGGSELKPLVKQCEALGQHFRFQKGGTKGTRWKDAWWTK